MLSGFLSAIAEKFDLMNTGPYAGHYHSFWLLFICFNWTSGEISEKEVKGKKFGGRTKSGRIVAHSDRVRWIAPVLFYFLSTDLFVTDGWFLYSLLEQKGRYLIEGPVSRGKKLQTSLDHYHPLLKDAFSIRLNFGQIYIKLSEYIPYHLPTWSMMSKMTPSSKSSVRKP